MKQVKGGWIEMSPQKSSTGKWVTRELEPISKVLISKGNNYSHLWALFGYLAMLKPLIQSRPRKNGGVIGWSPPKYSHLWAPFEVLAMLNLRCSLIFREFPRFCPRFFCVVREMAVNFLGHALPTKSKQALVGKTLWRISGAIRVELI